MAPLSYKAITSSPPFTFVVGEDEKEHTIHSALIAEQSHYFQDLVNGDCVASTERRVVWIQVEEETFTRFSQFVYTGDYDEVKLKKRKERVKTATSSQGESSKASKTVSKEEKPVLESLISPEKTKLLWDILQMGYQTLSGEFPSLRLPPSYEPDEDYTDIFLCHARVYFFAKQYGISNLGGFSLLKLVHALKSFNICAESYSEINQLFRYICERIAEKENQKDDLYLMVWLYAACKVEDLWKSAEFRELTVTSPNFSSGLITAILGQTCID